MRSLYQDVRYGLRMLLKKPGFTIVATLALALGIGANSAVFSVINAILLKPLPLDDLDRIVTLWERIPSQGVERNEASVANYLDWRGQSNSFENLAIYTWWSANLGGIEPPERVRGFLVSPNLLNTVGIKVVLGRSFRPDEDQPGRDNVAILTHGLWQRRFGGDPGVVGRVVNVDGKAHTIIGVMPQGVIFPRGAEILAPMAMTPETMRSRGSHSNLVVGRLKEGVSIEQAQSDLDAIAGRLERQYPNSNTGRGVGVFPILKDTVRQYEAVALMMMAAVAFVLLIACANVANLTLSRATGRMKEIALRLALGASRWRIIRQLLTESVILAVLGGAIGVLLAMWGVDALKAMMPDDAPAMMPGYDQLGLNSRVLVYTLAVSLVTGVLFGLAPAIQASKPDLNETLKDGAGKTEGAGRYRLRAALVVAEISLSLVLLFGAGLLMKNFLAILKINPGVNPDNVLTMGMTLPTAKYKDGAQRRAFYEELIRRARSLPGVETAALVSHLPLGGSNSSASFLVEGVPDPPPGQDFDGRYRVCTPDYFKTMGVPIVRGRSFTEADTSDSRRVIIVNETLAKRFWPNGDAIGKHIRFTGSLDRNPWMEVVGVVGDVKHEMVTPITPDYYLPLAQDAWETMFLVARTQTEPLVLAAPIRSEIQAIDRDQPIFEVNSMVQVRDRSIMHYRISSVVLSVFGVFALILAATGIYGVMAYAVSQRTREIGVRMALGAQRGDILKLLVIRQGMRMTAIGIVVGLAGAIGLAQVLKGMLYGVSAIEWATFTGVTLLLAGVSLLACYIPARRAAKVDPMVALRYE
ncbi:MAG TPA: ABC transporter permease [Blastocatellia bacterium]|nr:ABC transporter permease [Blastocatellia bacterium]